MNRPKPCLLMILDGWGIREERKGNAARLAATPHLDQLAATYARTRLTCSGSDVGLPDGIMGNSEVGHLNIGAGRIVYQDLLRIDRTIADGSFYKNPTFAALMQQIKARRGALHLMGLVSDGGVHSHLNHLKALLELAHRNDVKRIHVHAILDGRDTAPDSGIGYVQSLRRYMQETGIGRIATVCGRYFAMDRDQRWERTEKAYRLYTEGTGDIHTDPVAAIQSTYDQNQTDEFVTPIVIQETDDQPPGIVADEDGILFFNFRADRARQITRAFTDPKLDDFQRRMDRTACPYVCMTQYDASFSLPVAFGPTHLNDILGEVVSQSGLYQLRIAETEKYAHVTYFFNGGEEKPFPDEDRCLIPSPRDVATYDEKPDMSAHTVTREILERIDSDRYDFIVLNFANMDMVGHTGVLSAAMQACATVDACVGKIIAKVIQKKGTAIITADHGNAETMITAEGHVHTAHTLNPVPLILVDDIRRDCRLREGILADIAPTLLELMQLKQPDAMTGRSLIAPE